MAAKKNSTAKQCRVLLTKGGASTGKKASKAGLVAVPENGGKAGTRATGGEALASAGCGKQLAAAGRGQGSTAVGSGTELAAKAKVRRIKSDTARRREVEKAKSLVYGELTEIVEGIVKQAKKGNHNAAKFLLQFAGIPVGPKVAQPKASVTKDAPVEKAVEQSPEEAVQSVYRKLGLKPPVLLPPGTTRAAAENTAEPWMANFGEAAMRSPTPPNDGGMRHSGIGPASAEVGMGLPEMSSAGG
jgi:hypothetical protein